MTSSDKKYDVMVLSGGFDPVHIGHIRMMQAAKQMAHTVIIGLNSDEWLTRKKGKPFMQFEERREILEALECVDRVWAFKDDDGTANDLLMKVRGLLVSALNNHELTVAFGNGGDRTTDNVPEQEMCERLKIDMVWGVGGEDKPQSSSWLINNAKSD